MKPDKQGLKIAHILPVNAKLGAGIWNPTISIAQEQVKLGHRVFIVTSIINKSVTVPGIECSFWSNVGEIFSLLEQIRPDIVHLHSLWTLPCLVACLFCWRDKRPYFLSPHGMLMPAAMGRKQWKKIPYWNLIEKHLVANCQTVFVASEIEAKEVSKIFPKLAIQVAPFGAPEPEEGNVGLPHVLAGLEGYILYLGRIHPIKNLEALVETSGDLPDRWALVMAGNAGIPEYFHKLEKIDNWAKKVIYLGDVRGTLKWSLIKKAQVLVLPSHSENFGNVVLEALSVGTPVIASKGTPWSILELKNAGLWIDCNSVILREALYSVFAEPEIWETRRKNALNVAQKFSWRSVAKTLCDCYRVYSLSPWERVRVRGEVNDSHY